MLPDPRLLSEQVSAETGLDFTGREGHDSDGNRWYEFHPAGHAASQTFTLRTIVGWRRLDVIFKPGTFAAELLDAMGHADVTGQRDFQAVLSACSEAGAEVVLTLNGVPRTPDDPAIWSDKWRSLGLSIRKGMLAINEGNGAEDARLVALWTSRAAAAVLALLPVEAEGDVGDDVSAEVIGLPEGARIRIEVNQYERDRRNRAAALAIHGHCCKACDQELAERYGSQAVGLIEVHHLTPVSQVGDGYIIDPKTDLVPLCPNCHSVAHRRSPPFSIEEIRQMLAIRSGHP
jgi:5-methylcytosine-specific restriction protein A